MPMTLDPDLYNGKHVPLRYDLMFDHTEGIPAFYFSCRPEMLIEERLRRLSELYDKDGQIGEFLIGDKLGFGGTFNTCRIDLLPPEFKTWRAEVPAKVIGNDGDNNWLLMKQPQVTMCILESVLQFEDAPVNDRGLQQLLIIQAICEQRMHGASMAATLSPAFRQYVEEHRIVAESAAREAMIACAVRMWPEYFSGKTFSRRSAEREYRVWHHEDDRGLMLDVPGNAAGIYVDGSSLNDGPGWHLDCHNLDSVVQQLELLAGLCTMIRLYREHEYRFNKR